MTTPPRPHEIAQLCRELDNTFNDRITGTGVTELARQRNFYSKAIAAYYLMKEAGATPEDAVAATIDGGNDHGIDSVYIDAAENVWIIQSKYIDRGLGEPELGEVAKFRDGIRDLIAGNFGRFNQALQSKVSQITRALDNEATRIKAVLVYSGDALSDDRRHIMADLEQGFNSQANPDFLSFSNYGLSSLHDRLTNQYNNNPIDVDIKLSHYGCLETPYRSYYGCINAADLKTLRDNHGDALFEENIRNFKGSTIVNEGISTTIQQRADQLFYFNNGVTFLCESIAPIGPRDETRTHGKFRVRGLSIINGAQTVGSVARENPAHYELNPAQLLATFICLEGAEDDFAGQVTHYRNSQNTVNEKDFAALDENQKHWQQTLALDNIIYHYKSGLIRDEEALVSEEPDFTIDDAIRYLACRLTNAGWAEVLGLVKSKPQKLFSRHSARPEQVSYYDRIFCASLDARTIWRTVQIGERVRTAVIGRARTEMPQDKSILSNSIWLILHILLAKSHLLNGEEFNLTEDEKTKVSHWTDTIAQKIVEQAKAIDWGKQYPAVFSNASDIQRLKARVMVNLPRRL